MAYTLHMATFDDQDVSKTLQQIPNVGPAIAADLLRLGVKSVEALKGADPTVLYDKLSALDGQAHDPCVWDVFAAAIEYAESGQTKAWWHYTPKRKELFKNLDRTP